MTRVAHSKEDYFTFVFNIDPKLNDGYTEAFKQGDETWWWYSGNHDTSPAAGGIPDFTGATFKSLHQWAEKILEGVVK